MSGHFSRAEHGWLLLQRINQPSNPSVLELICAAGPGRWPGRAVRRRRAPCRPGVTPAHRRTPSARSSVLPPWPPPHRTPGPSSRLGRHGARVPAGRIRRVASRAAAQPADDLPAVPLWGGQLGEHGRNHSANGLGVLHVHKQHRRRALVGYRLG